MGGSNALPAHSRSTVSPFPPRYYNNNNLAHTGGVLGSNLNPTPAEAAQLMKTTTTHHHHHRCSSESIILQAEEQPAWLDDLLDEPDSPVLYKGHRRSASDSYAYVDTMSVDTFNKRKESMFNNFSNRQQWKSSDQSVTNSTDHASAPLKATPQLSSFGGQQNWVSESSPNSSIKLSNGLPPTRDGSITPQSSSSGIKACGGPAGPQESDRTTSKMMSLSTTTDHQKQDRAGSGACQNPKNSGENGDYSQPNTCSSFKADVKLHAKQKTAHRSRVRKLQYIAELERNVQVLQAEGSAVFAEIEFLDQNNLILSMENRALRQRLDSLSQEQVIKQLQHEMLEREVGRLQALLQFQMQQQLQQQQQQQQQRKQQNPKNSRAKYRDHLDSQFSNFSLNQNEASTSTVDSANSFVRI